MTLTRMQKGVAVALVHVTIVSSLGAKLLYDRATRPRVWVQTLPIDPNLPIRGRYVSLRLEVAVEGANGPTSAPAYRNGFGDGQRCFLAVKNGQLTAVLSEDQFSNEVVLVNSADNTKGTLTEPVAFFIPEHAKDPSWPRQHGDELWVEVTVPKKGPPRPIRLGIRKDGGEIEPMDVH